MSDEWNGGGNFAAKADSSWGGGDWGGDDEGGGTSLDNGDFGASGGNDGFAGNGSQDGNHNDGKCFNCGEDG